MEVSKLLRNEKIEAREACLARLVAGCDCSESPSVLHPSALKLLSEKAKWSLPISRTAHEKALGKVGSRAPTTPPSGCRSSIVWTCFSTEATDLTVSQRE